MEKRRSGVYVRNVIFGIEDSLAATVGLLSGLAAEHIPHEALLLTGFVYVFVEAVSMGIGSFLSEESAQEYEGKRTVSSSSSMLGSIAMFIACIVGGMVPVLPYLFLDYSVAMPTSIVLSLAFLGVLGFTQARISRMPVLARVLRMMVLGGAAIAVGVLVGKVVGAV